MTQVVTVPKSEWSPFFNRLSKALLGKSAEIEVVSLDLGDQVIAEWIPMIGITYEEGNDLLDVSLDRANHLIHHPREVLAEEGSTGLTSISVIDEDGANQIVRLKEPLMLPP
jgi:uncharacterized protein DUF5335